MLVPNGLGSYFGRIARTYFHVVSGPEVREHAVNGHNIEPRQKGVVPGGLVGVGFGLGVLDPLKDGLVGKQAAEQFPVSVPALVN